MAGGLNSCLGGRAWEQKLKLSPTYLASSIGEFGSVREAQLKQEDGSFEKVAVKMLKGEWGTGFQPWEGCNTFSSSEVETLEVKHCL